MPLKGERGHQGEKGPAKSVMAPFPPREISDGPFSSWPLFLPGSIFSDQTQADIIDVEFQSEEALGGETNDAHDLR